MQAWGPSFLAPAAAGPGEGAGTLSERGSGKEKVGPEGLGEAGPAWAGTATLASASVPSRLLRTALLSLEALGRPLAAGQGPWHRSRFVGSRPPAELHQVAQSHRHVHPMLTLKCWGGDWAQGFLPCGRGPAGLRIWTVTVVCQDGALVLHGMAQWGLCCPHLTWVSGRTGQAVARPAVSCRVVSAGDICSCVLV